MDSNTYSTGPAGKLTALLTAVDELADQDPDHLADLVLAAQARELRWALDRLEGHWLRTLATVDARGAAGAEEGLQAASTARWLRNRCEWGPVRPIGRSGRPERCSGVPCRAPRRR